MKKNGRKNTEGKQPHGRKQREERDREGEYACMQARETGKKGKSKRKKRKEKKESVCLLTLNAFYPIATHIVEPRRGRVYRRIAGV
jgi:hypothetical protein